jgi:hypothetical protein
MENLAKKKHKRERKIAKAIILTYDSLQSHLRWTYIKSTEGIGFHKKCVKEYTELIKILSELY